MSYALNISEDGRVLSATLPQYAPDTATQVDALPEGNLSDYRYADGAFVYDPPPTVYPLAAQDVEVGRIFTVGDAFYRATAPIPRGTPVTRFNAEPVSTVDILNALQEAQKGE